MSVIYAALNSVNTYRTPKTGLPLDVKLTTDEANELCKIERLFDVATYTSFELSRSFNLASTTNAGLYYFCIEKNFALRAVSANPNISPLIAFLIFRKISSLKPSASVPANLTSAGKVPDSSHNIVGAVSISYNLLYNPAVHNDLVLFKTIFDKTYSFAGKELLRALSDVSGRAHVGVLMLLLPEVGKAHDSTLSKKYLDVFHSRSEEILAWLAKNAPDVAGLPLSWVIRMYGIQE